MTVLGCAGTFPGPASGCSAYLVEHDGFRLLVDAGYGAVGALQRHGGLLDLDAVLISHLHADHCIDLVAYSYARWYDPRGHAPQLPVYGPTGTMERIAAAIASPHTDWLLKVYDWRTVDGAPLQIGPFAVRFARTNHPVECWAPRIEAGGASLAYTGDTGLCEDLVDLARDVDLLLAEASFLDGQDNPEGVHLTGGQAGAYAQRAGARQLLLTHLVSAWGDEQVTFQAARAEYAGDLGLARDGVTYPIPASVPGRDET